MRVNCFEPEFKLFIGDSRFNDYFKLHIFACNYVGISITVMGYGFSASIRIYDPSDGFKSDSNNTHGKTDG